MDDTAPVVYVLANENERNRNGGEKSAKSAWNAQNKISDVSSRSLPL